MGSRTQFASCVIALLGALGLFFACNQKGSTTSTGKAPLIKKITSASELIGGIEATGRIGDFLLSNGHARFIVEDAGSSTGWGMFGGALIDLDVVRDPSDPVKGDDRLQEMFYQCELRAFEPTGVTIVNDGRDGQSAVLRFVGRDHGIPLVDGAFHTESLGVEITVDYILPQDGNTLEIVLRAKDVAHMGSRDLNCGVVLIRGDAYEEFRDGTGWGRSSASEVQFLAAAAADSTSSYILYRANGPLMPVANIQAKVQPFNTESKNLITGATLESHLYVSVGRGDVESALAERRKVLKEASSSLREVKIAVHAPQGSTADVTRAMLTVSDEAGSPPKGALTSARAGHATGVASVFLPPGHYAIDGTFDGRDLAKKMIDVPGDGAGPIEASLDLLALGDLAIDTVQADKAGRPLGPTPAKLTLKAGRDQPPNAPSAFERFIAASEVVTIPPGSYTAYVSRGPEYDVDRQNVTVPAGGKATLHAKVAHVVNTDGWISADLHVHSTKSVDATAPRVLRVLGAIAEGVEILVATEHDMVADYSPIVHDLGLDSMLRPVSGIEVSPPYGHLNGMPFVAEKPEAYWRVGWYIYGQDERFQRLLEPAEIVRSLRSLGAEYVQINHPRSGQGVFKYLDLDPATGAPKKVGAEHPAADGFEILNSRNGGEFDQVLPDFIGLIKANRRMTGTGVSDAHSTFGIGYARTMIRVADDRPDRVDLSAAFKAIRDGRVVALSGPMVTLEARQGAKRAEIGEVLGASGDIELHVHVEAPAWMDVSSYRVLENGSVLSEGRIGDADRDPADPVVRLDKSFAAHVSADAFYMVIVEGAPGSRSEPVLQAQARSVTNPVFVDADGNGFHFGG